MARAERDRWDLATSVGATATMVAAQRALASAAGLIEDPFAAQLVRAGEDVRWLSRRKASSLLLPGNDFWMFDQQIVVFPHCSGDGHVLDHEITTNPTILAQCAEAFEQAWRIAIPHHAYTPA